MYSSPLYVQVTNIHVSITEWLLNQNAFAFSMEFTASQLQYITIVSNVSMY